MHLIFKRKSEQVGEALCNQARTENVRDTIQKIGKELGFKFDQVMIVVSTPKGPKVYSEFFKPQP